MEFYDVVEERRSIKNYKRDAIEKEKLYRILESLTLAPSWSCKHCLKIIVVEDEELRRKIAECVDDPNPVKTGLIDAPIIFVICADPNKSEEIDHKEYYMADCGIAMEHIMLAACNEGLATCWVGLFDEHKIKNLLEIPELIRVIAITPLGFANETVEQNKKKSIKQITFYQSWDNELVFK